MEFPKTLTLWSLDRSQEATHTVWVHCENFQVGLSGGCIYDRDHYKQTNKL